MKKVFICFICFIFASACTKPTATLPPSSFATLERGGIPIAHYELFNDEGDEKHATQSCIIRLKDTYKTDHTDSVILVSLQHQNDVLFENAPKDSLHYPKIGYFFDTQNNGFVAVSKKSLHDTTGVVAWFRACGNAFEVSQLDSIDTHFCIDKEIKPDKDLHTQLLVSSPLN